jgi:hypothetical protein
MRTFLPTLIIRTANATAAIELNGALVGEASPSSHLALPLSENGDYYIGVHPLADEGGRYYPVTRKLKFCDGNLQPPQSGDVTAYAWPDGVFEAVLSPGRLPRRATPVFPYTIDQRTLPDGCVATLYYEDGLRLAVEQGPRLVFGAILGDIRSGSIIIKENGLLAAVAGEPRIPGAQCLVGFGEKVVVLNRQYQEIIRVAGDAVGFERDNIIAFSRLFTALGHERRQVYGYRDSAYFEEEPQIGFFTHSPAAPQPGRSTIRAFCDAVRHNLWDEAFSCLTSGLQAGLHKEIILSCLGEFTGCRTPLARQDSAIGLTYAPSGGVIPVRLFSFAFEDGKIDNLTEE